MPGIDGIEATRRLRAALPEVKVVIVTTFGRPGLPASGAASPGPAGSSSRTPRPGSWPTPSAGCTPACASSTPTLAADSLAVGESPLTAREAEVLRAARDGGSVSDIAASVFLSEGTVRNHLSSAIGKTEARNRGDAVRVAEENGWL